MNIVEVEPRTPAWFELRRDAWSASLAAVLAAKPNAVLLQSLAAEKGITLDIEPLLSVGIDDFFGKTLWTEYMARTGAMPSFRGNTATERGQRNEDFVIDYFEGELMLATERNVTARKRDVAWLMASFDAIVPASSDPGAYAPYGFPLEAKCPAFASRKKLWDAKKSGTLAVMGLPYYWCQVQHQLLVSEAPYGWFVAVGVDESLEEKSAQFPIIEQVPRDDAFLKAYSAAAEFFFKEYLYMFEEPPMLDSDRVLYAAAVAEAQLIRDVEEANAHSLAEHYADAVKKAEEAVARVKLVEKNIAKLAQKFRTVTGPSELVELAEGRLQVTFGQAKVVSWQKTAESFSELIPESELNAAKAKFTTVRDVVKIREAV